jgi:predicted kinase
MKTNLYILIGLPGSGKTTWAKNKAKDDLRTVIISRDGFRSMIKGEGEYIFDNIYITLLKSNNFP